MTQALMAGGAMLASVLRKADSERVTKADRKEFRAVAERVLKEGAVSFGEMIY